MSQTLETKAFKTFRVFYLYVSQTRRTTPAVVSAVKEFYCSDEVSRVIPRKGGLYECSAQWNHNLWKGLLLSNVKAVST
jgi:hypothetical protein